MNDYNDKDQLNGSEPAGQSTGSSGTGQPEQREEPGQAPGTGYWSNSGQQDTDKGYGAQAPGQAPGYGQGYGGRSYTGGQAYKGSAPYSPPYSNNVYPPVQNPGAGYRPQGYGQGYQQPTGQNYQYSSTSGWQQPPKQQDKYEWKFEDYDQLDRKKTKGPKKRSRGLVVFTVALLCLLSVGLVSLAAFSIYSVYADDATAPEDAEVMESAVEEGVAPDAGELELAAKPNVSDPISADGKMTIPQVAQAVLPSVVGVIMYDNDQYYQIGGLGSGIIMSDDGYIITNAHVVADGTGYKVQLHNGDPYDAELIGSDALTDLAVLKIDATGLTPAQFGDSDQIEVGETVVAIGNPAGLELAGSVTQGIVSAVNREVRNTNSMTYIQTDAAINPGNSGGALANEFGQVIGINSNKIVAAGYEGIGFAIPISEAKPVIDDLISNGRVTGRTMLGITARTVDEVDARNYGVMMGLSIDTVDPESDLVSAGVQKGDILTHIDGERVYTLSDVRKVLDTKKPGDTVTLSLYRRIGSREVEFEVETRLMESQ